MRVVVQKVSKAKLEINNEVRCEIRAGLVVLVAISPEDNDETIKWMNNKLANLRIFPDENDKMNRSVLDISGDVMFVSNFTLYGDVRKGFRPNFMNSAVPDIAIPLYDKMVNHFRINYGLKTVTGEFGAMMQVELTNDGPVTIIIDSK